MLYAACAAGVQMILGKCTIRAYELEVLIWIRNY